MIINRKFKNNKKVEKAAALIALSADKEGKHGRCLLPEEMAALVDATCTKEQREIFMQHLSGCENCYKEWLTLKTMDQKVGRKVGRKVGAGVVYHLSRFKKYSYIGSALAVAASVVVFLNITHLLPPAEDKQFQKPVLMQAQPASESVISESKEMELPVPKSSSPAASDGLVRERLENRDAVTGIEDAPALKMKGLSAPTSRSVPQVAKKNKPAEVFGESSTQINAEVVGDAGDIDSWLEQLQKNCLAGKQDADFWEKMRLLGEDIQKKQAGFLPKDKEEKLSAVLVLLMEMDTKSVTSQCRQLLTLLAQEEKSR